MSRKEVTTLRVAMTYAVCTYERPSSEFRRASLNSECQLQFYASRFDDVTVSFVRVRVLINTVLRGMVQIGFRREVLDLNTVARP